MLHHAFKHCFRPFAAVGVSPVSRSSPSVPSTPSSTQKTPTPTTAPPAIPLASILSRVDINPNILLSALSKAQTHGGFQGEKWKIFFCWDMKFVNTVVQDVLSQHEIKINPIFV